MNVVGVAWSWIVLCLTDLIDEGGDVCPVGSYCPGNTPAPMSCPPGGYSNLTQLATCTVCETGYYCPAGTQDYTVYPCVPGYYCLSGGKQFGNLVRLSSNLMHYLIDLRQLNLFFLVCHVPWINLPAFIRLCDLLYVFKHYIVLFTCAFQLQYCSLFPDNYAFSVMYISLYFIHFTRPCVRQPRVRLIYCYIRHSFTLTLWLYFYFTPITWNIKCC